MMKSTFSLYSPIWDRWIETHKRLKWLFKGISTDLKIDLTITERCLLFFFFWIVDKHPNTEQPRSTYSCFVLPWWSDGLICHSLSHVMRYSCANQGKLSRHDTNSHLSVFQLWKFHKNYILKMPAGNVSPALW